MRDDTTTLARRGRRRPQRAALALAMALGMSLTGALAAPGHSAAAKHYRIGYVLHILIPFTAQIAQGARDAASDLGVDVNVVGPPAFSAPQEIGYFNGFLQQGYDGIVVVPNPPEAYPALIKRAVKAGTAIETANVISPRAKVGWFGQDEFQSGVLLAKQLVGLPTLRGKSGTIVIGDCAPGVSVLTARYNGIMQVLKTHSEFKVIGPFNVTGNPATNYSSWQSLYTAHTDAVAMIGLCALDNPDLAQLKAKYKASFVAAGYDLELATLRAIKAGQVQITVGQNPYLQGYLPVKAIADHLLRGKPLVTGWVNVGTEVVTPSNIDTYLARESSASLTRSFYHKLVVGKFSDLYASQEGYPAGS